MKDCIKIVIDEKLLKGPSSFTFLPDGSMLIVDESAHVLKIFSESGDLRKTIGGKGEHPDQFYYPTDIAVKEDRIYLTDRYHHTIKAIRFSGEEIWRKGGYGSADDKFKEPHGLAFVDDNMLAVTDSGNAKIKIYDINGNYVSSFGIRGIEKEYYESRSFKTKVIYKLWAGAQNRFNTIDTHFYDAGYDIGTMESPRGIAVNDGFFYVCDYSGRLQVFRDDGALFKTYYQNREEKGENLFSCIQWIQIKGKDILFTKERGNRIYAIHEDGSIDTFFESEDHFVEYFRLHNGYLYFMSPWERKLFRLKTHDSRQKTLDLENRK